MDSSGDDFRTAFIIYCYGILSAASKIYFFHTSVHGGGIDRHGGLRLYDRFWGFHAEGYGNDDAFAYRQASGPKNGMRRQQLFLLRIYCLCFGRND